MSRESERVRECESHRVTFEHRHENKSCSACQELVKERKSERVFQVFLAFQVFWFPAFVCPSDTFLYKGHNKLTVLL